MHKIISKRKKLLSLSKKILVWYLKRYCLGKDSPLIATFQLTHLCNFKCSMCTFWRDPQKQTLDLGVFKSVIKDLRRLGCAYISLSGGEPLVIENILSYVDFAKKNIPFVNLVTNGYLLDKDMAKDLALMELDSLSISIDGLEKTHDQIRGVQGAFRKALGAIALMKEFAPEVKITVNTVLAPWNLDELIDLAGLVESLGVLHKFQPVYTHPIFDTFGDKPQGLTLGNQSRSAEGGKEKQGLVTLSVNTEDTQESNIQKTNPDACYRGIRSVDSQQVYSTDWHMDKEEIGKITQIVAYLEEKKNVANSKYYLASIPAYFSGGNYSGLFKEKCKAVHFYCEIRENARLYPCIEAIGGAGGFNLLEKSLKEIYYSMEYRDTVKKLESCRGCQKILPICYVESRIAFPIASYLKYVLFSSGR